MKKIMSLEEFSRLNFFFPNAEYIYETGNQTQPANDILDTVYISMSFNKMQVFHSPNAICLQNDRDTLLLKKVKYVYEKRKSFATAKAYSVVCGNRKDDDHDVIHTVLIREAV